MYIYEKTELFLVKTNYNTNIICSKKEVQEKLLNDEVDKIYRLDINVVENKISPKEFIPKRYNKEDLENNIYLNSIYWTEKNGMRYTMRINKWN